MNKKFNYYKEEENRKKNIAKNYKKYLEDLTESEVIYLSEIFKIIDRFRLDNHSEKKVFIPINYFSKDIPKAVLIALLEKGEDDFEAWTFLGMINGADGKDLDIGVYDDEKYSLFKKLILEKQENFVSEIELEKEKIKYDSKKKVLSVGDRKYNISPRAKKEVVLFDIIFEKNSEEFVSWDEFCYEEYEVHEDEKEYSNKTKKMLRDLIRSVNKKIQLSIKTRGNLFSYQAGGIKRNF